jgi:N-acetylglucosaminyldiphosphoundecaprenol N-acetyl-beta-D-mannosaminyltransferase
MIRSSKSKLKYDIENDRNHGVILGVKVDSTTPPRVLRKVQFYITEAKKFYIVTPNPEIVMEAQKDKLLAKILNSANISLPDGIGLAQAQKFMSLPSGPKAFTGRWPNPKGIIKRFLTLVIQGLGVGFLTIVDRNNLNDTLKIIKGRNMFLELIKLANKRKWRVYLLGGENNEAQGTKYELEKTFKSVHIKSFSGPMLNNKGEPIGKSEKDVENKAVKMINDFKPHLLFMAAKFPRQEKWVYRWYKKLNIGGAMVVGGTFNFISGYKKLPPLWIEDRGLEWVWRLISGNQKFERIFRAFPEFAFKVFWRKFILYG